MHFISSVPTYEQDIASRTVWENLSQKLAAIDGIAYYKYPIISSSASKPPDLAVLARDHQVMAITCLPYRIEEINDVRDSYWIVNETRIDSPLLELEDFVIGLQHKFSRDRRLRHAIGTKAILAMPAISNSSFVAKFGAGKISNEIGIIWEDADIREAAIANTVILDENQWKLAKSIFQGVSPLNTVTLFHEESSESIGGAIQILEREIALLDDEQHKVAIQIAPGPQRIRGLAGTGKTVVLAMKAANIHLRFPDARILFTFHTQSLYNQAKQLISKFYRVHSDTDPDWEKIHIRHGWGGAAKPGVYSDICRRVGELPMNLSQAQAINSRSPFQACCERALKLSFSPEYDYVLVDEAQDFPKEFFRLLVRLATEERRICWAYDELQSLSAIEVPTAVELYGKDKTGEPLVRIDGDDYPGNIEKDFVLHRSYRCPQEVLMLAHGVGLGIHSPHGCVQMLRNEASWMSIGYELVQGRLVTGEPISIHRPSVNSPNRVSEIYTGTKPLIQIKSFPTRQEELTWIGSSIAEDVNLENVKPEHIVVISLDTRGSKRYLLQVQKILQENGVMSTIPGLVNASSEFAEPGMVTLSTIYRAKGNEAPIVYVLGFEYLYQYVEELEIRNRAFTSISRSKGWLRLSGIGQKMEDAKKEIRSIMDEIPYFRFSYPDVDRIRCLDASETSRRRREVRKANESVNQLLRVDRAALNELDPEVLNQLKAFLRDSNDD
jgi:superfamily I DNA and RNA helicase